MSCSRRTVGRERWCGSWFEVNVEAVAAPKALGPESPLRATPQEISEAYRFCARLARRHYENFTIASYLMPREMRPHMYAVYAYARGADDLADEARSLAGLDRWEEELERAFAGQPRGPVFIALADTVRRFALPIDPFRDLLTAFRSDVNFRGFETREDLLAYARCSANPVGRIVLAMFGYRDPERCGLSDQICTGLQFANFWQDIGVDLEKGRVYLPREDLRRFGVSEGDLRAGLVDDRFKALMRHEIDVARSMLVKGSTLFRLVNGRLSRDILMFAGGGMAILRAIERVDYDVFRHRPTLSKLDYVRLGAHALAGKLFAHGFV